jgi:hypothetical protein
MDSSEQKWWKDFPQGLALERTVRQRLAKYIVLNCFRNTHVEDIHAGKILPAKYLGREYSRITDTEMKELNIEMVNRVFEIIDIFFDGDEFHKEYRNKYLHTCRRETLNLSDIIHPIPRGGRIKKASSVVARIERSEIWIKPSARRNPSSVRGHHPPSRPAARPA